MVKTQVLSEQYSTCDRYEAEAEIYPENWFYAKSRDTLKNGVNFSCKQDKNRTLDFNWLKVDPYALKLGVKSWLLSINERFFMRSAAWWQLVRGHVSMAV